MAVVDEPVELCVTHLRYAQIHGFWRSFVKVSPLGKEPLSLRVNQAILVTRSDRPSGCRWPAIRRVALHVGNAYCLKLPRETFAHSRLHDQGNRPWLRDSAWE
ncbi:MAG TPA: hypothetical protein VMU69_01635, partial [Bradyrhizobium sp.]|nr:hypothetical protein [Bradyrhizobium sp.]